MEPPCGAEATEPAAQLGRLEETLHQRDEEISILSLRGGRVWGEGGREGEGEGGREGGEGRESVSNS